MSDLTSLLASILPYAIGALFSPLILYTLLATISPSNRPRLSSFAFLFGSVVIFLILVFIGLYIGTALFGINGRPVQTGAIVETVLGIILLIIAVKTIFVGEESRSGGLTSFINLQKNNFLSIFLKFFYFGLIAVLASFTTAIFITIAGIIIGLSNPGFTNSAITVTILGLISLFVVEISFIFYALSPEAAEDVLDPFREWAPKYGDYLTGIVYFILGLFFITRGFYSF